MAHKMLKKVPHKKSNLKKKSTFGIKSATSGQVEASILQGKTVLPSTNIKFFFPQKKCKVSTLCFLLLQNFEKA